MSGLEETAKKFEEQDQVFEAPNGYSDRKFFEYMKTVVSNNEEVLGAEIDLKADEISFEITYTYDGVENFDIYSLEFEAGEIQGKDRTYNKKEDEDTEEPKNARSQFSGKVAENAYQVSKKAIQNPGICPDGREVKQELREEDRELLDP